MTSEFVPDPTKAVFAESLLGFLQETTSSPERARAFETAAKLVEGKADAAELDDPAAIARVRQKLVGLLEAFGDSAGTRLGASAAAGRGGVTGRARAAVAAASKQPTDQGFERMHPRGRGGKWMEKGQGMSESEPPDGQVHQLQQRLTELGFKLVQDGRFGGITEQAVKAFQTQYGLSPTGKVDEITVETMRNPPPKTAAQANAEINAQLNPPKKGSTRSTAGAAPRADDVVDSQGNVVRAGSGGGSSGARGAQPATARSTTAASTGAATTGTTGAGSTASTTQASATGSSSQAGASPPSRKQRSGTGSELVRRGDGMLGTPDSSVEKLQQQLDDLGYELGDGGVDGKFGQDTEATIKLIQRRYGLRVDGIVGPQTRDLLTRLMRKRAANAKHPVTVDQEADRLKEAAMEGQTFDPELHPRDDDGKFIQPDEDELVEASYKGVGPSPNFGTRVAWGGIGGVLPPAPDVSGDDDESMPTPGPRKGPVGWGGGEDLFGQRPARTPPNLREATEGKFPRCSTCVHFNTQRLCMFYSAGVDSDDLCDSWLTLTPAAFQQLALSAAQAAARMTESSARTDQARAKRQADRACALVEVAVPTHDPMYEHRVGTLMSKGLTRAQAGPRAAQVLAKQRIEQARRGVVGHQLTPSGLLAEAEELGSPLRYESAPWGYEDHAGAYWLLPLDEVPVAELIAEAADSLAKASVHEPVGKPGGPGLWHHKGLQLPAYIQHIANDIKEKRGKSESQAIAIAIGAVKRWARGGGNVDSGTKAAAAKALAEWTALKASHGGGGAKKLAEAAVVSEAAVDLSTEGRKKMAGKGQAMAHGGYPIPNATYLKKAIQAFGRAKNKDAAKRHIIKRAKALGATGMLPQGWLQENVDTLFEVGPPPLELTESARPFDGSELTEALSISFDPNLHPRNRTGQFRDVLGALQRATRGAEVTLPGGVSVKRRSGERLSIYQGGKRVRSGGSLDEIVHQALTLSGSPTTDEPPSLGLQTDRYRIADVKLDPGSRLGRELDPQIAALMGNRTYTGAGPAPTGPQGLRRPGFAGLGSSPVDKAERYMTGEKADRGDRERHRALQGQLAQVRAARATVPTRDIQQNFNEERRLMGQMQSLRKIGAKADPGDLEGPFTYPSGWKGRYDPTEGRYLGMDDIYQPRDFDPHQVTPTNPSSPSRGEQSRAMAEKLGEKRDPGAVSRGMRDNAAMLRAGSKLNPVDFKGGVVPPAWAARAAEAGRAAAGLDAAAAKLERGEKLDTGASPQYTPQFAGTNMQHMQFENAIQPGHQVDVRWTRTNNAYAGHATVVRKNPSSVTVKLDRPATSNSGATVEAGTEVQVPLMLGQGTTRHSINNGIFPRGNTPGLSGEKLDPGTGDPRSRLHAHLRGKGVAFPEETAYRILNPSSRYYFEELTPTRTHVKHGHVTHMRATGRINIPDEGRKVNVDVVHTAPIGKPGQRTKWHTKVTERS